MKNSIQLKDFLDFKYMSNLQYAPDEKHCAFVVHKGEEADNAYTSNIYIFDGKEYAPLTSNGKESMYIWEDESHILFANIREQKDQEAIERGEERTVFYRICLHGGEAQRAFHIPLHVTSIKAIEDGQYLFTADYDIMYSHMYMLDEEKKAEVLKAKKENKDYEILDEIPFYANGGGFTNKKRNSLFLYNANTEQITRVSDELFYVGSYAISDDHTTLYYVGESFVSKLKNKDALITYNIKTQKRKILLEADKYSISKVIPWKHQLLLIASEQKQYGLNENAKFYRMDIASGKVELFADYENAMGSSVGSDARYGGGRFVKAYEDKIYFLTTLYNRSVIYKLDIVGKIEPVYDAEGSVDDFDIAKEHMVFCGMQDMRLQEVYSCDIKGSSRHQITFLNENFYEHKDIRSCNACNVQQEDMTLYGWVLTPHKYDPKKSYPAILDIHGGPKTVYGEVYYHEMQVWANMGYFVFFMNPRGADGRGNDFADIRSKYGTIDYDDLMKFTDKVLETYPSIDVNRVGVTGGSYGGFMCNWIIGHTNRFKAAASQRSISNWISFANTSDIGEIFAQDQQGGNPWDDNEKLWNSSPLKYAQNCVTPTLFIHSDEDYRCPLTEGIQMYSALCNKGIDTRMCLFHGENHELSRSGKPRHRIKRLEEITNWMEKYLK